MNETSPSKPVALRRFVGAPKGRQVDPAVRLAVAECLGDAPRERHLLVEHLHRLQDAHGHLSLPVLAALADLMRLAQAEVYEVATFYHHFDVVHDGEAPPPPLTVRVCESLSCEMAGAQQLAAALAANASDAVRIQKVPCVGRCAEAPVAIVGRLPVAPATAATVQEAIDGGRYDCAPSPSAQRLAAALGAGRYGRLRALQAGEVDRESLIDALDAAGLRGFGGAGFPTARKWRTVAAQPGPRMLVVNADEGEPGTFKDRDWLEREPHLFLEGMLIAAWTVGCDACWIYLRDEYAGVRALLTQELAALRAAPPPGVVLPQIELRRGAGAYICGEESALIESLEGKRGMPRLRPPYVAQVGLFGRPTLAHNVETLCWVPRILEHGPEWFARNGRRGRSGLRSFSVSGRVRSPGVKHAPAGISLRELVDEYCGGMADGHQLRGYLPGGASGGILPAALADLPLDFDTLQPHGCFIGSAAIVVLSQADAIRDVVSNLMRFFRDESCGQCTPCRVGTAKAAELLRAPRWDAALLGELGRTMADASICGLGQAAPNPVQCALRYFAQDVDALTGD